MVKTKVKMEKHSAALIYICDPQPGALWHGDKNWILSHLGTLWTLRVLYIPLGVDQMNLNPAGMVGGGELVEEVLYMKWFEII